MPQRAHYPEQNSKEVQWKTSSKPVPSYHEPRVDRPEGKKFVGAKFSDPKDHFQKKHMPECAAETTKTHDNPKLTKVTFD